MNLEELDKIISKLKDQIIGIYGKRSSDPTLKFAQMVKIQEELGELAEQVLKMDQLQRNEKGEFNREDLKKEFADVLLSLLIFAKTLDFSIKEILDSKLDHIVKRYLEK